MKMKMKIKMKISLNEIICVVCLNDRYVIGLPFTKRKGKRERAARFLSSSSLLYRPMHIRMSYVIE